MYNYNDYLSDNLDKNRYIEYSEYISEHLNSVVDYSEYISSQVDYSISFSEYIAENLYGKTKQQIQKEERIEKLQKINNINDGIQ